MNNPVNLTYSFSELGITAEQIGINMGYLPGTTPDPINEMINSVIKTADDHADIKGKYLILKDPFPLDDHQRIRINRKIFNTGRIVTEHISGSGHILFFIFTAGKGIELQSQKYLGEDDPLRGYIYDVLGSILVNKAIDRMQDSVEREMRLKGLRISSSYSPGYCGWPITDQQKLFSLFPDKPCGVILSETYMMDPVKSVSGIFGIGKNVKKYPNKCDVCDLKNCIYRDKLR